MNMKKTKSSKKIVLKITMSMTLGEKRVQKTHVPDTINVDLIHPKDTNSGPSKNFISFLPLIICNLSYLPIILSLISSNSWLFT